MSAVEWLPFITPFVWMLLILNVLALLPIQSKQPLPFRVKFTIILLIVDLLGWLLAIAAIHIMTPVIRINVLQLSQLVLTPTLIVLSIMVVCRLIQGKNLLNTILKSLGKLLKPCLRFLILITPTILRIIVKGHSKYVEEKPEDDRRAKERKKCNDLHINWRGEYSGEDDINEY